MGQCHQWFNQPSNCRASCAWDNCPKPCDDVPNPLVWVSFNGVLQTTCPQQAALGYCTAGWMHEFACRRSCGRCSGSRVTAGVTAGVAAGVSGLASAGIAADVAGNVDVSINTVDQPILDATVLIDQGSSCVSNKGMPSTRFVETQSGTRAVDDFIVPAGQTWSLTELQVMGTWFKEALPVDDPADAVTSESTTFVPFDVTVFHAGSIQCKTTVPVALPVPPVVTLDISSALCTVVGAQEDVDGSLKMVDQTYYLTVAPLTHVTNQFYWSFSKTTNGQTFKWRDMKDLFGFGLCPTWTDGNKCGLPTRGTDMCFKLLGSSAQTTEMDTVYMVTAQTSNGGDGEIGSDTREGGAWDPAKAQAEEEALVILRENAKLILADLTETEEQVTTISENSEVKIAGESEESDWHNDSWVIPVSVTLAIFGALVVVLVVVLVAHSRGAFHSRRYAEVA